LNERNRSIDAVPTTHSGGPSPRSARARSAEFESLGVMKPVVAIFILLLLSAPALAGSPDCSGPQRWPAAMAFVHLKNAGITNNDELDFDKTKTVRLASEKIAKDLYRQIHIVTFTEKSGEIVQAITNSDASNEECSMSGVEVYLVSKQIGAQLPPNPSFKRGALKHAP